jgi:hypothetical protein
MTRRLAIYVAVLAVLVVYFLIWPVWRAQFLIEIWPTEAWNGYFQDAAAGGSRLYPPTDALIGNNYPPLSFYAIGYLGQLLGDNLYVGRAVSIVALLALSVEIFLAVRILTGGVTGAAVGALWYAAITAHSSELYIGTNDPQLAGEAIMGAGLVWFLARDRDRRSALAPLLLMVAAGFWKHNIVAIPLTAIVWLLLRNGKEAVRPVVVSAVAAGAGLLLCTAIYGRAFPDNLFATREYSIGHVIGHIGHLQWFAVAFLIWASWAWSARTSAAAVYRAACRDRSCHLHPAMVRTRRRPQRRVRSGHRARNRHRRGVRADRDQSAGAAHRRGTQPRPAAGAAGAAARRLGPARLGAGAAQSGVSNAHACRARRRRAGRGYQGRRLLQQQGGMPGGGKTVRRR